MSFFTVTPKEKRRLERLARRASDDKRARDEFMRVSYPYIATMARQISTSTGITDSDDLRQAGALSIVTALLDGDSDVEKLIGNAYWAMKSEKGRLQHHASGTSIIWSVRAARRQLLNEKGREPTVKEVHEFLLKHKNIRPTMNTTAAALAAIEPPRHLDFAPANDNSIGEIGSVGDGFERALMQYDEYPSLAEEEALPVLHDEFERRLLALQPHQRRIILHYLEYESLPLLAEDQKMSIGQVKLVFRNLLKRMGAQDESRHSIKQRIKHGEIQMKVKEYPWLLRLLTARQRQYVEAVFSGEPVTDIARKCGVKYTTVTYALESSYKKLEKEEKRCERCRLLHPISQFYERTYDSGKSFRPYCLDCEKVIKSTIYSDKSDEIKAQRKQSYDANRAEKLKQKRESRERRKSVSLK